MSKPADLGPALRPLNAGHRFLPMVEPLTGRPNSIVTIAVQAPGLFCGHNHAFGFCSGTTCKQTTGFKPPEAQVINKLALLMIIPDHFRQPGGATLQPGHYFPQISHH